MRKSFTLIELIVVIAIIAILAAIIAPNAFKAIEKAKVSKAVSDIKAIKTAALSFYADTGTLPCNKVGGWGEDPGFATPVTSANCWDVELAAPDDCSTPGVCIDISGWDGPYLEKWAKSPWYKEIPGAPYGYGGAYNWNRWLNQSIPGGGSCGLAGIVTFEIYGAVPVTSVQKIDEVLDDGNLTLGKVHISGAVDNPNYLKLFVVCQ